MFQNHIYSGWLFVLFTALSLDKCTVPCVHHDGVNRMAALT